MKAGRKRLRPVTTQRGIAMGQPLVMLTILKLKVATRRLKGLEKINIAPDRHVISGATDDGQTWYFARNGLTNVSAKCPFGKIGDFLYLKEPFIQYTDKVFTTKSMVEDGAGYPWKSSRFMPKAAASVWVKITDIQVQRLGDMTDDEIHDEGVVHLQNFQGSPGESDIDLFGVPGDPTITGISAKSAWERLFGKCFGPITIEQNPYVWAIHYQLTEKPPLQ